jgi:hypothetical protein
MSNLTWNFLHWLQTYPENYAAGILALLCLCSNCAHVGKGLSTHGLELHVAQIHLVHN